MGKLEHADVKSDLATVRIPVKNLPVMPLGSSSEIRLGEFVIAMGNPRLLSNTITTGVVSSVNRTTSELRIRHRDVPGYIQTDATIAPGSSGGPLVNLDGEAIGINSMTLTPGNKTFSISLKTSRKYQYIIFLIPNLHVSD